MPGGSEPGGAAANAAADAAGQAPQTGRPKGRA